jgi:hypothetical protein
LLKLLAGAARKPEPESPDLMLITREIARG